MRSWMAYAVGLGALLCSFMAMAAAPEELAASSEMRYVFNSFVLLMSGALVMWMAGGFCMLEAGMVSTRSTAVICLKNVVLYALASVCFYVIGYDLMFTNVSGWLGQFGFLADLARSEFALISGQTGAEAEVLKKDYSDMAILFFQTTFVATTASVTSGALAERVKLWPFFIFVIVLVTFIYPIQGSWSWGGGWLAEKGFADFAGSTVVHSVGGWAALTGVFFLGPRSRKYAADGSANNMFPSSVPLISLGVLILWLGWLGFNGGSVLVSSDVASMSKMSLIFMNTNIAAASGVVVALFVGRFLYGRVNILLILNGALAGLVSITAGPDFSQPLHAVLVGGVGSVLAMLSYPVLDHFKLDDVVGAIPVHLVAGIWGTLAVGIWGEPDFFVQLIGVLAVGAFTVVTSAAMWWILKLTMGIRVSPSIEDLGQDLLELGIEEDADTINVVSMAGEQQ